MLATYLKIGIRYLFRNRFFSIINLTGLTIGLTCFILIGFYIQYELSYDHQHEKADQIYRVAQVQKGNEFQGTDRFAVAPKPLAPTLKAQFPEVESATTITLDETLVSTENKSFYADGLFADAFLFDVFTYPLVEGTATAALEDPQSVIITSTMAKKHFGEVSPLGRTLQLEEDKTLTVKGVLKDLPRNQHFSFDYITSIQNYRYFEESSSWSSNNYYAYIVLPEDYDPDVLNQKMKVLETYTQPAYEEFPFTATYYLQALKDIHLKSNINFEIGPISDIKYLYLAASIGIIMLLLALMNYTNLTTARTAARLKELGVQKVLGAKKTQVTGQFVTESFILTSSSLVLAFIIAFSLLPTFNALIGSHIPTSAYEKTPVILLIMAIVLVFGSLSGLYPALLSAGVTPVKALKSARFTTHSGITVRNTMVILQFAASIILAISSMVIYLQLNFISHKQLGYNKDQIVYVHLQQTDFYNKKQLIKEELLGHPQIKKVTLSSNIPIHSDNQTIIEQWEGNPGDQSIQIYRNYVDADYLKVFEMELAAGRNFSDTFPTDSTESVLLNQAAVKKLGWTSPIGKSFHGKQVIGVLKDYHFQPFKFTIEPLLVGYRTKHRSFYSSYIAIKLGVGDLENTLAHIQSVMQTHIPEIPFSYAFMNESFEYLYRSEKRFGGVFIIFTIIALFIACMGLLGLVTQKISERAKEIGVRKVLGASLVNIVLLFSKDFLRLVAVAVIVAIPFGWWGMESWLQNFAYRIEINWTVFLLAAALGLGVAFLTIGMQTITAAKRSPVHSLNEE